MTVSGVGEGISRREMRHSDANLSTVLGNSVNLVHHFDTVVEMLKDIVGMDLLKRTVPQWPGKNVQIMNDFRSGTGNAIYVDRVF